MSQQTNFYLTAWLLVFLVLSGSVPLRAQTTNSTVIVQDGSGSGSPFSVSGSVTIRETRRGDAVRVSITENDISTKNISSQTILAVVAWLEITPAYGSPRRFVRQYECFFASDVIKPGDEHGVSEPSDSEAEEPFDADDPPRAPRAEIRFVYVQFIDGSIFGHEGFGEHLMTLRRQTRKHLSNLEKTYDRQGEAAFLEELYQPAEPGEVDALIGNVRGTQRQRGTLAAVAQIRAMLNHAKERQQAFDQTSNP